MGVIGTAAFIRELREHFYPQPVSLDRTKNHYRLAETSDVKSRCGFGALDRVHFNACRVDCALGVTPGAIRRVTFSPRLNSQTSSSYFNLETAQSSCVWIVVDPLTR